jgi:GNAT superfamily N-acetyltransferase
VDARVERVASEVGLPLRQRVLRPHQTLEQLRAPDDDAPDTGNYAAFADGEVVATGSVRREAPPWAPTVDDAWRLRGMATDDGWRSRGVGSRVLDAIIEHVRARGGGLLWCNARVPAVQFYERAGFVTRGAVWEEPVIGPHVAMARRVEASAAPQA